MAGRPRSFDRDAALETALNAFWERGYNATSVAALTEAIDIRPPSLYAAFGDKEALFEEAVALYVRRLHEAVDEALADPDARAGVEALMLQAAAAHTAPDQPRGCLAHSEPSLAHERARVRDTIAARLHRARDEGQLPRGADPDALGAYFDIVLAGMSASARDGATHEQLVDTVRLAMGAWPERQPSDRVTSSAS